METQRSNNSTNSIQFANLITGKHTLKPDNVIKSKPFLFFSSPSHFISLQPLPRDSTITSASFSYLSFLLILSFYHSFHILSRVLFSVRYAPHFNPPLPIHRVIHFPFHSLYFSSFYFSEISVRRENHRVSFVPFSTRQAKADNPTPGGRVSTYPNPCRIIHSSGGAISR